ncbi:MAG: iron oxidase [Caulobacteraceae bacterium]|jgi:hypothetical protein|nr:iron oxidase [Caulobacteraceae bacterium]
MPDITLDKQAFGTNRRQLIGRVTLIIGLAGIVGTGLAPCRTIAAPAKLPANEAGYQPTPKGDARCELCANWQAPNGCKVVAGPISPSGWCHLFARKT